VEAFLFSGGLMSVLNQQQLDQAKNIMNEYLSAPAMEDGLTPAESSHKWDEERIKIIKNELNPLLKGYLDGNIPLPDFKSQVDSINKRNSLWGFQGFKGQVFFNLVFNVADDMDECDQELKSAIAVPANNKMASSRIKTFASYVKRIGAQWVEAGNTRHRVPRIGSIPFFLSYFWHIHDHISWPIYYTNSVNTMSDLDMWQPTGDLAEDYLTFKSIYEEFADFFSKISGKPFNFYEVEHVFWYRGKKVKSGRPEGPGEEPGEPDKDQLPESYVPPIVAILPRIAKHDEALVQAAEKSGTTLERAFEKYIYAAFTILGYDSKLMGQGGGRVPDGLARAIDDNYAIIWDAKVRSDTYNMGTDDRTIREYITTQSRELKKRRSIRNIYYFIISSRFADDHEDAIRNIKMETDVSDVCLVEAGALVAMVDAKLRSPHDVTLGPDGLQRIFSSGGTITEEMVKEQLI
jgi:hypothetical protein